MSTAETGENSFIGIFVTFNNACKKRWKTSSHTNLVKFYIYSYLLFYDINFFLNFPLPLSLISKSHEVFYYSIA